MGSRSSVMGSTSSSTSSEFSAALSSCMHVTGAREHFTTT
eukprot:CAMPEP_0174728338 /NCGR_PEP_ID=MMETSP1094-20130205/51547_1 /TAXON_ID=156173 /ORGANISM="Chrysochromulina brevifilum, Strain UTEX LB 985" /LENGTH=39 /DNA_ID= /DNA_START= /DNA_END= /DNA_ORIENTATION=